MMTSTDTEGLKMAPFVPVEPFDLVIFGGTGDLSRRKLLPALFRRDRAGQFCDNSRIIALSRHEIAAQDFVDFVGGAVRRHVEEDEFDEATWQRFSRRLHHQRLDVTAAEGWDSLGAELAREPQHIRVFYLAMLPSLYGISASKLARAGLTNERSRIVLEKPVGSDFASARSINDEVGRAFAESQVFRIDHYLGKETVQNLAALRFANSLFEPLWRHAAVDHVQITVAEDLGIGDRAEFYDHTGALRDMVQNHMLQLLCLVAMEPPISLGHEDLRAEKIKVLKALRPITPENVQRVTVRGQYAPGVVAGERVPGYQDELGQQQASDTETFVAIKAEIDNWRWAQTPFYLRTGKRLASKSSEIVLQFRPVAFSMFPRESGKLESNRLVIRLQPNEGVQLSIVTKEPGPGGFRLRSLPLNLSFSDTYPIRYPDAYERLLVEVLRGDPALFMHREEVERAWQWIDGIIESWRQSGMKTQDYVAGSWGPADAVRLLDRDGREWRDPLAE
jgi:glucose-6-phosphate 1-dehydrogenase